LKTLLNGLHRIDRIFLALHERNLDERAQKVQAPASPLRLL